MTNLHALRERYLRDPVPTRLGGLAANLGRMGSFASLGTAPEVLESLLEESKHFIEWTAAETDAAVAGELVQLQIELARWQRRWDDLRSNPQVQRQFATVAGSWSDRLLQISGLLP